MYPPLDDDKFQEKIARRKEFRDASYDGNIDDVTEMSDKLCNAEYELAPHQQFVRNFLSSQTPYNSLLLYHGLGTGKTCSAITVAEEARDFIKNSRTSNGNKIIVVASPNVQENFRLQLFNEENLNPYSDAYGWTLKNSCVGNKFIREITQSNNGKLFKKEEKNVLIRKINRIIDNNYMFKGYEQFYNYFEKKIVISSKLDTKTQQKMFKQKIKKMFSNSVIIIDEAHNLRSENENSEKNDDTQRKKMLKGVTLILERLADNADNLKLLLLSATPMYNSPKEIIALLNLMNRNDGRRTIRSDQVFDSSGNFLLSDNGSEIGRELLERQAQGYVSFVRGENPYTFPYRIWPSNFEPKSSIHNNKPKFKLNGSKLVDGIKTLDLFITGIASTQEVAYEYIMNRLNTGKNIVHIKNDKLNYNMVQTPIQALNIVYPHEDLSNNSGPIDLKEMVGKSGLDRIMSWKEEKSATPKRDNFDYKDRDTYEDIFSPDKIGKYSSKIKTICDRVMNSEGVVLVYSQFIDGGLVPLALALEQLGFTRAGTKKTLFVENRLPMNKTNLKYAMITGDKAFSPDNVEELRIVTQTKNMNGDFAKVVLISRAGSEGLDFKFIRQVHIMEPWFNLNRVEQIIGRAVRTCSHKSLEFSKRNVEIYLHCLSLKSGFESIDMYMYRKAEIKSIQIGNVSRALKNVSTDCLLNISQTNFSENIMKQTKKLTLSTRHEDGNSKEIYYNIGDKPYSSACDYMKNCEHQCNMIDYGTSVKDTYHSTFMYQDIDEIKKTIKEMMTENFFFRKTELVKKLKEFKMYPSSKIETALNDIVEKREQIIDKYDRRGRLIKAGDLYIYQPQTLNNDKISLYERTRPIEKKIQRVRVNLSDTQTVEGFEDMGSNVMREVNNRYQFILGNNNTLETKTRFQQKTYDLLREAYAEFVGNKKDVSTMNNVVATRLIEELKCNDLNKLICHVVNTNNDEKNEILDMCKEYLENRQVQHKTNSSIHYLLYDVNKNENTYSGIKIDREKGICKNEKDISKRALKKGIEVINSRDLHIPYIFMGPVNPSDELSVMKRVKQLGFTGVKDATPQRARDELLFRYNDAKSEEGKRWVLSLIEHQLVSQDNKSKKN